MLSLSPEPTGPFSIGRLSLHLIDEARIDALAPERQAREIMVSLWYPSEANLSDAASYVEPSMAGIFSESLAMPEGVFAGLRSHAREGAALRGTDTPYPVIVFSHGGGLWRNAGSLLVEDLVSNGNVVVTIDHPYDAVAVAFPTGRIVLARPLEMPPDLSLAQWDEWAPLYLATRVGDVRYVLDVLSAARDGRVEATSLTELALGVIVACDFRRVGMFGHSLGGCTTVETIRADDRVCAGAMLDSPLPAASRGVTIRRPLLLIQCDTAFPAVFIDESWSAAREDIEGWYCRLRLPDANHQDFSDLPAIAQVARGLQAQTALIDVQRALLLKFFSRHLGEGRSLP